MLALCRLINNKKPELPQRRKICHLLQWSDLLLAPQFSQEEMENTSDACGQLSK